MTISKKNHTSRFLFAFLVMLCLGKAPVDGSILFAGDSDIEGWKKTGKLYPKSKNKGVGGTTCKQWVGRIDKWLKKYKPDTVVLVCGENDLAYGQSPFKAFANFKKIVKKNTAKRATTIYMGTKPEPDTKDLHKKYRKYDALIRDWGKNQENFVMIDVYPSFEALGNPKKLYKKDKLHLSSKGYNYWNTWLQAALDDNSDCALWESGECA